MFDPLTLQRLAHALHRRGGRAPARALMLICRQLFACQLSPETEFGPGCELAYGGLGVVVHAEAYVGREVLLSPGVVLGGRSELRGAPRIGDGVRIGVGAKVLGPVVVGAGALIGANAVVLHDVAPGDIVAGVPARSVRRGLRVLDGAK